MLSRRGCKREEQVLVLKTVARMKWVKNGKGLGAGVSREMLLGSVEVGVVLSALKALESHSMSRTHHRTTSQHPFLNLS